MGSQNSVSNKAFGSAIRDTVKFSMMSCVVGSVGSQTDERELEPPLIPT